MRIEGGRTLSGHVRIHGAKNAALPIMAAALLSEGAVVVEDIPTLDDVITMGRLLEELGAKVEAGRDGAMHITPGPTLAYEAPYDLVRRMRASFLVVGPLLARLGRARASLPGGCAIGSRPVDLHLKGFEAMGAKVRLASGAVEVTAAQLTGARIYLDYPSVTATENILMAACLARGQTIVENAAEEPEVVDLANYLNSMGARIRGAGTKVITVDGTDRLSGTRYTVIPDRIEAGTFLVAVGITGGDITIGNVIPDHLKSVIAKLRETGMVIGETDDGLRAGGDGRPRPVDLKTLPYPGFPTDLQAPMMSLLSFTAGTSVITETVFENRFLHVDELKRMGADITIDGRSAITRGTGGLTGASVNATDLRAGAALVLAGLGAEGRTEISGMHHIDRGYANLAEKFRALGAEISRH